MNTEVSWPRDQGVIGVLGVAPMATADFFMKLADRPVHKDWDHARVFIDSNPKIPSRGRFLELGETDPVPYLREGITGLLNLGATVVAIPCNTAHIFYERYSAGFDSCIPNMIDLVAEKAKAHNLVSPLVLASKATINHELYTRAFHKLGIQSIDFPDQGLVSQAIEMVKQNRHDSEICERIKRAVASFDGVDSVVLGCTELGMVVPQIESLFLLDSNKILADFCVDYIMGTSSVEVVDFK